MKKEELSVSPSASSKAIDRNISAVHEVRRVSDKNRRFDVKLIESVATFFGGPKALYTHLIVYGILLISHFFPVTVYLKPSLDLINMATSLEAIFLALFVLINQRRTSAVERKNSDLHLQMSLLAEHEVTRNAQMLVLICKSLNIDIKSISGLDEVKKDVRPEEMIDKISQHQKANPTDSNTET